MHPGELTGVRDVEVEGAQDAQVLVDGRRELDRAGAGELEGAGQVAGDGVGQGARVRDRSRPPISVGGGAAGGAMASARVRSRACA